MSPDRRYPRTARINELLREIVADALEEEADDERLALVTVTAIEAEPDLRHARVYFSARHEDAEEALKECRIRLQAAIGRQARFRRTPQLSFVPDPAIASGWRIEGILKGLKQDGTQ